jgi:hypothetical protein
MQSFTAIELAQLMSLFERKAYDNGYQIIKAIEPKPKDRFYQVESTNHAFIGFCLAQK